MKITGIGCCLLDSVYSGFDINASEVRKLLSRNQGDGGLMEGKLVFFEDLLKFAGISYDELEELLTHGNPPKTTNLGGPSVVAMVNVAQILEEYENVNVSFEGMIADDAAGKRIEEVLSKTPLKNSLKIIEGGHSPVTMVLAGDNERTFVNEIGAANQMTPHLVSEDFYTSNIVLCGGTALVPNIHDNLSQILRKVKSHGGITVVGTVFDFRNEKKAPNKPWPLVDEGNWNDIDVLVVDADEALRISGKADLDEAAEFFMGKVGALLITQGSKKIWIWASDNGLFIPHPLEKMPVSKAIDDLLASDRSLKHDSTGCGDNFVGGVLSSIALQRINAPEKKLDIIDLCAWGAASGGFTLLYDGGTFIERTPGEKASRLRKLAEQYHQQIGQ